MLVHIILTKYFYGVTTYRHSEATSRLNSHEAALLASFKDVFSLFLIKWYTAAAITLLELYLYEEVKVILHLTLSFV